MGRIKVLSEEVSNRIAAGEVIERPASIVKELVENAIDAEAKRIVVRIEKGGKNFISVSDNGIGMSEDDAILAFERHATSKIRTVNDIFHISTKGFRGEALPSIASISKLVLVTKQESDEMATKVVFNAGFLKNVTKTSANSGTTITVERLFHNIPARKKFLKTDQVEYRHILNYLHYQSIVHPHVHFIFISNEKEKLNYPAVNSIEERLTAVFGSEFHNKDLIRIKSENDQVKMSGFISGLEETQAGLADFRYLFVNGRFIKDKIILHSLKIAYEPFIKKTRTYQSGKVPPYVIFMEINPTLVDFNVHPAKLEIRFRDTQLIHQFVKSTVSNALFDYEEQKFSSARQKFTSPVVNSPVTTLENQLYKNKIEPIAKKKIELKQENVYQPDLFQSEKKEERVEFQQKEEFVAKPVQKEIGGFHAQPVQQKVDVSSEEEAVNPWQVHQSYIFIQVDDGIMVIDQHAAHERFLYEKILSRIDGNMPDTQKLLFPIVIDIPPYIASYVAEIVNENLPVFEKIGFSIKTFSGSSIVIDEIPTELEDWDGGEIFIEILRQLQIEFEQTENFRDSIAKSVSCKAAIKAGKKMTKKEMLKLITDLFSCESPYFCPHGRPLMFKITLDELEKRFKRVL